MAKKKGFSMSPGTPTSPAELDHFVKATSTPQDEEMSKRITIDMTAAMHRSLKLYAVEQGRPMNKILREWIQKELDSQKI
jgi:predicted HicB family RNase H-like nuclease